MKVFLIACLAVAVCAEPDSQFLYTAGVPLVRPVTYVNPLTVAIKPEAEIKKAEEEVKVEVEPYKMEEEKDKITLKTNQVPVMYTTSPYLTTLTNPLVPHVRLLGKREAEADPMWLTYSNWGINRAIIPSAIPTVRSIVPAVRTAVPVASPLTYTTLNTGSVQGVVNGKTYANNANIFTQGYGAKGTYVADSVGARHVAKREADAQFITYSNLGLNMGINTAVLPAMYNRPLVYNTAATTLINPVAGVVGAKTYSNQAIQLTPGYAGKGTYVADSVGARHVAKREADSQWISTYGSPLVSPLRTSYIGSPLTTYTSYNAWNPLVRPYYLG